MFRLDGLFRPLQRRLKRWRRRPYFREKAGLLLLLATAAVLGWFHEHMPLLLQILLWALWFLVLALAVRRPMAILFGPVFLYDLVRSSRRSNFALLRSIYVGALLGMLFLVYSSVGIHTTGNTYWEILWSPARVQVREIARVSEAFFYTFAGVQFAAVVLLTPLCAAGALTE